MESFEKQQARLQVIIPYKIGFLGAGNMAQAIIKGLIEAKVISANSIFATNRSAGKLQRLVENFGINPLSNNEQLIDQTDVVILGVKPQDLSEAIDPILSIFHEKQIVISLAAGITLKALKKKLPHCRLVRLMPNTPSLISRGVLGYVVDDNQDQGLDTLMEDLFSPLGYVIKVDDESQFEALSVACAAGTGFVFELMLYWQEWLEEHDFPKEIARKMTVETFAGASMLAAQNATSDIQELLNKVTSKKGITEAGLQSMRELEVERALRYSFEKSALRNQELGKNSQ